MSIDLTKISIIIPTLNEAETIERSIASIIHNEEIEIIIVDGGSSDRTVEIAQTMGIKVLSATGGRSRQMNIGAQLATGQILLFLHADTRLPPDFAILIRQIFTSAKPRIIAGAFALKIDAPLWQLRLIEWGANWRSRLAKMPYGDQGIFLKTEIFHQIGGFPDLPIMEDFELMRQLAKLGRIKIISTPVITSARRWLKKGIFQTTIINQIIILAYLFGISPHQLRDWYRGSK